MVKLTIALFIAAILPFSSWGNAVLEGELVEKLATADPDELIHINLVMVNRVSPEELEAAVEGLPKEAARAYVISALKDKAEATQADLRDEGKDNEYGWGLIQCLPAIEFALEGEIPAVVCPASGE